MTDADIVREALERLPWTRENVDAVKALDRLEALSQVHVTQASHDLLVAEGWLDPAQARALKDARDRLKVALQKLYNYTVALEKASGAWFASRSAAKVPEGGEEAGRRGATSVSDNAVYRYRLYRGGVGWWVDCVVVYPGALGIGPPERWRPTRAWAERVGRRWVKRGGGVA